MKKLHLVFPRDYVEGIKEELEEDGFEIVNIDTSLDTFSHWAQSNQENNAEVAVVYGVAVVSKGDNHFSQKQAIYERLRRNQIE